MSARESDAAIVTLKPRPESSDRTFRLILYDAIASEAMATLTTGVFLTGYAVQLNASNFAIGLLAAVPFAVQFLQLPAVALVERLRARRSICACAAGIGRTFLLVVALAPLLGPSVGIVLVIVPVALYQGMAAVAGCAWNSWMRDLVPESEYGRFFGRRTAATTLVATTVALLGGVAIDAWKRHVPGHAALGYSLLFLVSTLIGFYGVWLLSITPDRPMTADETRVQIVRLLAMPFRDANFRRLMAFLSSWNFAANLASPFFAVYMLKTLGYSMTTIMFFTTASQLGNLGALGLWGNLIDRFSNKAVLEIAVPLFLICTLAWIITGLTWVQPAMIYLLLVIHVVMGIATAGVALASGNIAMKLSPAGQATAYLAANSVTSATCAAIAPMIGGLFADFFAAHELTLNVTWKGSSRALTVELLKFQSWTFLFGIACLVGLYALRRLTFVEEAAGTTDRLLLRNILLEARRSVHSLSTAAGLLRVARPPLWLLTPGSARRVRRRPPDGREAKSFDPWNT